VAKQPTTVKELSQWQTERDRIEQEWRDWYRDYGRYFRTVSGDYGRYFRTVSEAWHAFSEQWQGTTTFLDLKPSLKKGK
jgi:hypothetical protein